ncbi:MAG: hypothetical protein HOV66_29050 [Streptomycetaceae bacterium]|jgi:hypothetical protein|nr:hypothetical protein [Streptomycetaceae bacterium]NUS58870.1 hypothetical protein [Streptomycetaceae bacterium]
MSELQAVDAAVAALIAQVGLKAAADGLGAVKDVALLPVKTAAKAAAAAVRTARQAKLDHESFRATRAARTNRKYQRPSTVNHQLKQSTRRPHPAKQMQIATGLG